MAASKCNYILVYPNHSQVYSCASKKTAIDSLPPEGYTIEDKRILFATFEPDTNSFCVYPVSPDELEATETKTIRKKRND